MNRNAERVGEPERHGRERRVEGQSLTPEVELVVFFALDDAIGGGIQVRRSSAGSRGGQAVQQVEVQIASPLRHNVHHDQADALLEQRQALGDKGIAVGGAVLIAWADEFNRPDEASSTKVTVDLDLDLLLDERKGDGLGGRRWRQTDGATVSAGVAPTRPDGADGGSAARRTVGSSSVATSISRRY